jgi:hypothetical protein
MCDKWVNCWSDCTDCNGKRLDKEDCFGILLARRGKENGRLVVVISHKILELIPIEEKIKDTDGCTLFYNWGCDVAELDVGYSEENKRRSKWLDILYYGNKVSIETRAEEVIKRTREILTNALNSIVDYPEQVIY